jgi:hypothetical protein
MGKRIYIRPKHDCSKNNYICANCEEKRASFLFQPDLEDIRDIFNELWSVYGDGGFPSMYEHGFDDFYSMCTVRVDLSKEDFEYHLVDALASGLYDPDDMIQLFLDWPELIEEIDGEKLKQLTEAFEEQCQNWQTENDN